MRQDAYHAHLGPGSYDYKDVRVGARVEEGREGGRVGALDALGGKARGQGREGPRLAPGRLCMWVRPAVSLVQGYDCCACARALCVWLWVLCSGCCHGVEGAAGWP